MKQLRQPRTHGCPTLRSMPWQGLLALMQRYSGDITFPLTSCLMRHCATAPATALSPQQRATIVRLAAQQVGREAEAARLCGRQRG